MQNGAEIDRIGVFNIPNLSELSKQGNGRYSLETTGEEIIQPEAMLNADIQQGYTEDSNVQSVLELTNMMSIMRSYESVSKFLKQAEDLNRRAIERLGKV